MFESLKLALSPRRVINSSLTLDGHQGGVTCAAFFASGRQIITGSSDCAVNIYEIKYAGLSRYEGSQIGRLQGFAGGVLGLAVSPDGEHVAVITEDETVTLCETRRFNDGSFCLPHPIVLKRLHTSPVFLVSFSPDSRYLLTASSESIRLWGVDSGEHLGILIQKSPPILSVLLGEDDCTIAFGDNTLKRWRTPDHNEWHHWRLDYSLDREQAPFRLDQTHHWVSSRHAYLLAGIRGQQVILSSYYGSNEPLEISRKGLTPTALAFLEQDNCIAIGFADGSLGIWALRKTRGKPGKPSVRARELYSLKGHDDKINALSFSYEADCGLVSASTDKTSLFWRLNETRLYTKIRGSGWNA